MMTYSYATHASCPKCQTIYSIEEVQQLCSCGSPLLIKYNLNTLKKNWDRDKLGNRINSLWRYHELLPIKEEKNIVTQGEGMTPLLHLEKLGERLDLSLLYMKDEGIIPTGSFKARGAAVGVSKAKELGIQKLAIPTNGNAGAAWAMYATKAGIETMIVMPLDAPLVSDEEIQILQREVTTLEGAFICPEGAATFAAAKKLREEGWIGRDEKVICLNTGLGIKYADLVSEEPLTILEPSEL